MAVNPLPPRSILDPSFPKNILMDLDDGHSVTTENGECEIVVVTECHPGPSRMFLRKRWLNLDGPGWRGSG